MFVFVITFPQGFQSQFLWTELRVVYRSRNCVQVKSTCVGNLYSFPGIFYSKSIFQLRQFLLHNLGIFFAQKLFSLKIFIQTLIIMLIKCSVDQTWRCDYCWKWYWCLHGSGIPETPGGFNPYPITLYPFHPLSIHVFIFITLTLM